MAETKKIPKSRFKLQRPADPRHALARIEEQRVWVTSRNPQLAGLFAALITRETPLTVEKSGAAICWGTYLGQVQRDGTIVLDRKPDGRFKLVALDTTPNSLVEELAQLIGTDGSVASQEGKHGLVFRGVLRNPDDKFVVEGEIPLDIEDEPDLAEQDSPGEFEVVTGPDAVAAVGQKVSLEFLENGVKVRIRGKQKDCEAVAQQIIKGSPTVSSQQGAKYMIEGNLKRAFLKKGPNQQGPDAHGVFAREDSSERTFTAFGENLPAVQAAADLGCKKGTICTIVVNDRSKGYLVISSGKRRPN